MIFYTLILFISRKNSVEFVWRLECFLDNAKCVLVIHVYVKCGIYDMLSFCDRIRECVDDKYEMTMRLYINEAFIVVR